ncbi:MAG: hypothetical protein HOI47_03210 [Candidatus Scalindua sp.]|jgi:hypothetical protein|nr:hypothetical protein [Candidatus Scalindua sp.]MBT6225649.1 hypothetical protein [Candidatus Scalindua sp.]
MADKGNKDKKHNFENIVQLLVDALQRMTICENEVNKAIVKIRKSSNTQGTKGADHKYLLFPKIAGLKRLAVLYRSVSEKYINSIDKMADGISEDKVMADLLPYSTSINDQLKSEKECYEQVLSILRA